MMRRSSSHTDTLVDTTRSLSAYQRPLSKRSSDVVAFWLAESPSMFERPTTLPPQPPTMSVRWSGPTGKVSPQKKSMPSTRWASSDSS